MARSRSSRQRPNVVHKGQRATLNGKPVIADGKGNWVAVTKGTYGNAQYGGKKAGSYKPGENRKPTKSKPTKVKVSDHIGMTKGKRYPASGRNWSNPYGQKSNKPSEGDRSTWPTRKPTPTTTTTTTPTPTTSSSSTATPAEKKPSTKPKGRTWLADNYKPGKGRSYRSTAGNNAKGRTKRLMDALNSVAPKRASLKTKPAKPAATKPTKPAATKPTKPAKPAAVKPLTVPTNQIPKNLSSAAGTKYFADLDAGKLTRKRK